MRTTVADVLRRRTAKVVTIAPSATLADAARELTARDIGFLPVVDQRGALLGVVSERDMVRTLAQHGAAVAAIKVDQVFVREAVTCAPQTDVHGAIAVMHEKRIRHLPVVDNGKLTGVVSLNDLVIHLLRKAEQAVELFVL
jgi:CBS domain-containing protein